MIMGRQSIAKPNTDSCRYCGGAVISPFEVDQLSDDWIEVFIGLADDLPKMQTAQKQADQKFVEFRSRMKYRSYLN